MVQVSVDACPVRIEAGFAAKLTVGGTWLTVTVADAVARLVKFRDRVTPRDDWRAAYAAGLQAFEQRLGGGVLG